MKKIVVILILTLVFTHLARAVECGDDIPSEEGPLNEYITSCQNKISNLKGQQATLAAAIDYFTTQINLTQAQINATQQELDKLTLEIQDLSGKIESLNLSLQDLTRIFVQRVRQAYIRASLPSFYALFSSQGFADFFRRYHYLKVLQNHDRQVLVNLEKSRLDFDAQKQAKEIKQQQIAALKQKLQAQQASLAQQKAAKNKLLEDTKNSEKRYQQLLSQAQKQLAAFSRFVSLRGGASLLDHQTDCDDWGCYYNQRDSQWGNLGIGLSDSSMAEYGCLVTSMAMIASHYGKNLTPKDIASSPDPFWGNTAYMLQGTWTVSGVTMTRTRIGYSLADLDAELAKGKPVIVGIYGGPDHFLVVKRKEGDDYIINDPFVPQGKDLKFTSQYPLSAISVVDRVQVN